MNGSFKDTDSLGTLFGAIADVLGKREEMLLERIALLEEKIEQLEDKVALLEENALCFEDAEDGQEEESAGMPGEEVEEPEIVGHEDEFPDGKVHEEEPLSYEESAEEDFEAFEPEEEATAVEEELPEIEVELEFDFDDEEEEVVVEEVDDYAEVEDKAEDCREEDDEPVLVLDKVRPDWYDWEVDIPGHYIDDIREGIGLNDKILFMNELFGGSVEVFNETIDDLNQMHNLVGTVEYLRERFPDWDEESDEVYRFYMTVRRRFNKQK